MKINTEKRLLFLKKKQILTIYIFKYLMNVNVFFICVIYLIVVMYSNKIIRHFVMKNKINKQIKISCFALIFNIFILHLLFLGLKKTFIFKLNIFKISKLYANVSTFFIYIYLKLKLKESKQLRKKHFIR